MKTCEHVDPALIEQERQAWIARAVAVGMPEADARAIAAKMPSLSPTESAAEPAAAKPARKRAPAAASKPRRKKATSSGAANPAQPTSPVPVEAAAPVVEVISPRQAALPGFADELRAIPNHLARSPLFAPIRPGRRPLRQGEQLPSPQGVTIHYSGPQLDQADCDAFMQLIWEQRGAPLGAPVKIVRQAFLSAIGRADGGKNYAWLQATLDRLQSARVKVENARYVMTAQLLGKVIEDKLAATFHIVMDQDIVEMFAPSARSLVDWEKRLQISVRVDLAKWLHNFTASHKDQQQFHSLENLRNWSGYSSPLRKFKEATAEALDELARLQIISDPQFYERRHPETKKKEQMVSWVRL